MDKYAIGVDIGSRTAKAVLLKDGEISAHRVISTGWKPAEAAKLILKEIKAFPDLAEGDNVPIFSTGYGRDTVKDRTRSVTEITCHARGAKYLFPEVATVIDIGGQDAKVISIDPSGLVMDFAMNDRCAAGTGRFLEFMALSMNVSIEEFARMGVGSDNPAQISSMCTVFAESEMISLISSGSREPDVVAGLHRAIARRIASMAEQVGCREPVLFAGGVANNPAVLEALRDTLGMELHVVGDPVLNGALGAALLAAGE